MIIDRLENAKLYYGLGERIASGLKFLQENDLSQKEPGKYEIDGANIYLLVQEYMTKPVEEGKLEAHRKYIDIQYIFKGSEKIGYANTDVLTGSFEYSQEKDIIFFEGYGEAITFKEGGFGIFFPEDAHAPCLAVGNPELAKKAVVKVLIK